MLGQAHSAEEMPAVGAHSFLQGIQADGTDVLLAVPVKRDHGPHLTGLPTGSFEGQTVSGDRAQWKLI